MTMIAPEFFAASLALRGAAPAEGMAEMIRLAFGAPGDAQAQAARTHLREREGWHVLASGEGWRMVPCRPLPRAKSPN
jgi:hypothetical protein